MMTHILLIILVALVPIVSLILGMLHGKLRSRRAETFWLCVHCSQERAVRLNSFCAACAYVFSLDEGAQTFLLGRYEEQVQAVIDRRWM